MWLWFAARSRIGYLPVVTAVHRRLPDSVSHSTAYRRRIAFCDSLMDISLWFDARYGDGSRRFALLRKRSSVAVWVLSYNGPVGELLRDAKKIGARGVIVVARPARLSPSGALPRRGGAAGEENSVPPIQKEEDMTVRQRYDGIVAWFSEHMPAAESELRYKDPYQLLVAVILSAQCTDKRVNMTTPALFEAFPTPFEMAKATAEEIYPYIRSISYPNNKAKNLAAMARMLCSEFGGEVPSDLEQMQPHGYSSYWRGNLCI